MSRDNENADGYCSVHRYFLQALLARGILSQAEVKKTFEFAKQAASTSEPNDISQLQLKDVVRVIKERVKDIGFEIKKCIDDDERQYFVLLSKRSSEATREGAMFNVNQFEYLKKIIAIMMESDDASIGSFAALNLADELAKKLRKREAEEFLNKLVLGKWLREDDDGRYFLHVRATCELESYLRENFACPACLLCKSIVVAAKDQTCDACDSRVHKRCLAQFGGQKCPNAECNAPWIHSLPARAGASTAAPAASQLPARSIKQELTDDNNGVKQEVDNADERPTTNGHASSSRSKRSRKS